MKFYVCSVFTFLIVPIISEEVIKDITVEARPDSSKPSENNATFGNESLQIERIIQPSLSQSQQIERTVHPVLVNGNKNSNNKDTNSSRVQMHNKPDNFIPSPQLDTYYEYNRFPVVPAFPEAKQFPSINYYENPLRTEKEPWSQKSVSFYSTSTSETPWQNKIQFPTPATSLLTVGDHPYPYVRNGNKQLPVGYNYEATTTGTYNFGNSAKKTSNFGYQNNFEHQFTTEGTKKFGIISSFDTLLKDEIPVQNFGKSPSSFGYEMMKTTPNMQKTIYDLSVDDKYRDPFAASPWKKVLKFLTAFIPIGLLISALTPSVITINPTNSTQIRSRAEDNEKLVTTQLISSLNKYNGSGCEERVLCELLLNAVSSKNAEHHVDNLLRTFAEKESNIAAKAEEMKDVFDAVKKGSCKTLPCEKIRGSQNEET